MTLNRITRILCSIAAVASIVVFMLTSQAATPFPGGNGLAEIFANTPFKPKIGDWAAYKIVTPTETSAMRLAVVSNEDAGDGGSWLEIRMHQQALSEDMIVKMRLDRSGPGRIRIGQQYLQIGDQAPFDLSRRHGKVLMLHAFDPNCRKCGRPYRRVGVETMKVRDAKGGKVRAIHTKVRRTNGALLDVWQSKEIPLFGLVRMKDKGSQIELIGFGHDALSQMHGTPQPFEFIIDAGMLRTLQAFAIGLGIDAGH